MNLNTYKSTLYLVAAIAVIEFIVNLSLAWPEFEDVTVSRVGVALVVLFGLWVQSKLARYVGAAWFLLSAGTIIWPLFTIDKWRFSPVVILFLISGGLGLIVAYILVLSKTFAAEFLEEQNTQPEYKRTLKKAFVITVMLAAGIAILYDLLFVA